MLPKREKTASAGSIVICQSGEFRDGFLLAMEGGGTTVEFEEDFEVTIVSPSSPLGSALLNREEGDELSFPNGAPVRVIGLA